MAFGKSGNFYLMSLSHRTILDGEGHFSSFLSATLRTPCAPHMELACCTGMLVQGPCSSSPYIVIQQNHCLLSHIVFSLLLFQDESFQEERCKVDIMLIYANQLHECCHIALLSNGTDEISLRLLLSCKQPSSAGVEHSGTRHLGWLMASVSQDLLRVVGREAVRSVCAVTCSLGRKRFSLSVHTGCIACLCECV
jgi:hypothetical protein